MKFYLHIPVVTYKMVDPTRKNAIFKQIDGPLWFEDPEDYETEVPKLLGAARWHVLLNEAGVHGHLMHAYFAAGSWDDYPLTIDLNTLVRAGAEERGLHSVAEEKQGSNSVGQSPR